MNSAKSGTLITNFTNLESQQWRIVNDGVMGGVSHSHLQINESGNAVFLGTVSLENNGGFCSVKNENRLNLGGNRAFLLRIKGDGNRYSFRIRTTEGGEKLRHQYEYRFDTSHNTWTEIEIPFEKFEAVYRGQKLTDVPLPDFSSIAEYGFLISDKQEGDFRLEIDWIKAV